MCLSGDNSNDTFTSRAALHLSTTTMRKVGGFKEQPCVIWGVIVSIYVIVVQGKTVVRSSCFISYATGLYINFVLCVS